MIHQPANHLAGQRATMTLPGSRSVEYGYDAGGYLESITDWEAREIGFSYSDARQRTEVTRPNDVTTTYGYDGAGRLNSILHEDATTTLASYSYTLDAAGNRTSVTSGAGTESYVYDELNRLTEVEYPNSDLVEYTYNANDNRLTAALNSTPVATYTYDDADQLVSDGTNSYTYDDAGNMTAAGADSYSWDWANRLTSATVNSVVTTFSYDGDNLRTSRTANSVTTDYVWDRVGGLPLVVDDETKAYLHADGLVAEIDDSDDALYHLTDALGSVRGLTDESGAVVGSTSYAAFGEVRSTSGTTSAYGYTGELSDPTTGLSYLRARYADPGLGRFLSMDTVQPNAPGTQGYNRCAYVANNPATWTDPTGQSPESLVCAMMVHRAITNLIGISIFAAARGLLVGAHKKGVYAIGVGAAFVASGAGAEKLLGDTDYVRAGEAIAGGMLVANGLAIGLSVTGVPHVSMVTALALILAGVLLLLVGAIMQVIAELVESAVIFWSIYSPGSIACRRLLAGGQIQSAATTGQQSPRGWSPSNLIKASTTLPRLP